MLSPLEPYRSFHFAVAELSGCRYDRLAFSTTVALSAQALCPHSIESRHLDLGFWYISIDECGISAIENIQEYMAPVRIERGVDVDSPRLSPDLRPLTNLIPRYV